MAKRRLQDMVAKNGRKNTIRPEPARRQTNSEKRINTMKQGGPRSASSRMSRSLAGQFRGPRYTFWFVALISVVFFLFSLSYLFSKTVVTVTPKTEEIALNQNFSAGKDNSEDTLSFDLVVISGEEQRIVETSEEKDISQKAEGSVIIYNDFSSTSQRLDINTRLEGSNGKIYKTEKGIVVPGRTADGKPGNVKVRVYAAEAGESYNSEPLDFTIVGFKGTSKYAKFYGRSDGPITKGLKGNFPFIPDKEKASVINELKTALQLKLLNKAREQIPDGFVLFRDAVFLDIDDSTIDLTSAEDGLVPIQLKGTLYGILFDEDELTSTIARESLAEYDGSEVYLKNIQDLIFSLRSPQTRLFNESDGSLEDVKNINFTLSGPLQFIWTVDENKLTTDLLGQSKKDFGQVLLQYPYIHSAELSVSPFWRQSLPNKMRDIEIVVVDPR